ncbi:MAG: alginate lyase family protein [Rhodothermales bacterium]|nr:alginate lyase family protein [Rhodothermales bacterium]MBO6780753.1 alginate lyase family protein [Rhodothermales bacterium]
MSLSPRQFARKVPRALRRRIRHRAARLRDSVSSTHERVGETGQIRRYLPDLSESVPQDQYIPLAGMTANYMAGRFDLLGSGWLSWTYGAAPPGREGHRYDSGPPVRADEDGDWMAGRISTKNLPAARKLWRMVSGPYEPIDWQLDARSGARWHAASHTLDTPIGRRRGADVKLPWELARLHHLPRLAVAFGLARKGADGFCLASEYHRAFRNQVCDFLAMNPPRYGANWSTAMIVGIRLVNLLVAHDLFRAAGAQFEEAFEEVMHRTVLEHAHHVLQHLDWWDLDGRNNHYLANLAGLAFAGAFLPDGAEARAMLCFARRELDRELAHQFNADGSHFEGSTAYHAFSAEMVAWTLAILKAADAPSDAPMQTIPREARRRAEAVEPRSWIGLQKACRPLLQFLLAVHRPDGLLLQVGDNDSGRLLRLDCMAEATSLAAIRRRYLNLRELPEDDSVFWDEHPLDYRSTVETLAAVSNLPSPMGGSASHAAMCQLVSGPLPHAPPLDGLETSTRGRSESESRRLKSIPGARTHTQRFPAAGPGSLRDGVHQHFFPDAGLAVFRSQRLFLSVRCGGTGRSDGGHAHADALSFELHLDGQTLRVDPGAYVYTSLPWRRAQFRSEAAHGTPRLRGQSTAEDGAAVFAPLDQESRLLALDGCGLVGLRETAEGRVFRLIEIRDREVVVTDVSENGQPIHVEPLPWWSPGYGRLTAFESDQAANRPVDDLERVSRRHRADRAADDERNTRRQTSSGDRSTA